MEVIFGNEFLNGKSLTYKEIVLVLFAANKYPPCESFILKLARIYNEENRFGKVFEVIFISLDDNLEDFSAQTEYMPWLILPFHKKQRTKRLLSKYQINLVPTLLLIDHQGEIILRNCKEDIDRLDKNAVEFWMVFLSKHLTSNQYK